MGSRVVTDELVGFVGEFEGFVAEPYWDVDHWSHGHGTRCEEDSPPISRREARCQLRHELNEVVPSIPRLERLKQQEIDALASLGYNLGPRVLVDEEFSTLARRLKSPEGREFEDRRDIWHDEIRKWCSPGTIYEAGLLRRRMAETVLARTGDFG
jgi:GH24 family phage-related lysozyme (muramidase)